MGPFLAKKWPVIGKWYFATTEKAFIVHCGKKMHKTVLLSRIKFYKTTN